MNRLRSLVTGRLITRLILVFVLATALPLGLTLWTTLQLLDRSLDLAPLGELEAVTERLESTGKTLYRQATESLRADAAEGLIDPRHYSLVDAADGSNAADLPEQARALLEADLESASDETAGDAAPPGEAFALAGERGDVLEYYVRRGDEVLVYSRPMGVELDYVTEEIAAARRALDEPVLRDFRRGFSRTLLVIMAVLWLTALAAMVLLAARISRPVRQLTKELARVAAGDLDARVPAGGPGEIGEALDGFNRMAAQLQHAREELIQVTRLASWQALARKTAHEVKNSLTPIRLTMEEIVSRKGQSDPAFLEQAAQIVADEVNTLERRVRAFGQFASEPPVSLVTIDLKAMIEERAQLLGSAHPALEYRLRFAPVDLQAKADPDLVKGILTNLLENAADAAAETAGGGVVLVRAGVAGATENNGDGPGNVSPRLCVEVHDSGAGLSEQARSSLFEPSISFKKGGMGLGLSIARRSALLCGGDLEICEGVLGGAGFRLVLPVADRAEPERVDDSARQTPVEKVPSEGTPLESELERSGG